MNKEHENKNIKEMGLNWDKPAPTITINLIVEDVVLKMIQEN